jgi:hypothetical protein
VTITGPLLKKTPTIPEVVAEQVTESGGLMVIGHVIPKAPVASVTLTEKPPVAVGVPVMAPVLVSVKPAGSAPTVENV